MPSGTLGVGVGCCPETLQCQGKEEVVVSSKKKEKKNVTVSIERKKRIGEPQRSIASSV